MEAIASGSIAATFKTLVKLVHPVTLARHQGWPPYGKKMVASVVIKLGC